MRIENIRSVKPGTTVAVSNSGATLLAGKQKNRTCLVIQNTHGSNVLRVGSQDAITNSRWIAVPAGGIYLYYGVAPIYAQASAGSINAQMVPILGVDNSLDTSSHSQVAVDSTRTQILKRNRRRIWTEISNVGASAVAIGDKSVLFGARGISLAAGAIMSWPGGDELWAIAGGTNEVQRLTITGTLTAGSFVLTWQGHGTTIPFNANAAAMQALLETHPLIGAGNIAVTGTGPFDFTFQGELAAKNVAAMTINNAGLTGGTGAITTETAGASATAVNLNLREEKYG